MKILSVETSCDETAISIVTALGGVKDPHFEILGNALYSQAKTHAEYGGVFPALAKREHAKNILPLLKMSLDIASKNGLEFEETSHLDEKQIEEVRKMLEREADLSIEFVEFAKTQPKPKIDAIAVTNGPGLEPALWVGINFAKALNLIWNIPVVPVNHMEGHIVSVLLGNETQNEVNFPALALLISGGHTELVEINDWSSYKVIGRTRDDAVGEAFDKVARILGMPYPGGPQISKLAAEFRMSPQTKTFTLPRPMISSPDFDFSFSGIKTAVLYTVKKIENITDNQKKELAAEFENAVTEVLVSKTKKAIEETGAQTLIIGGGVVANTYIRAEFEKLIKEHFPNVSLRVPSVDLSTDNSVMIAMAGYLQLVSGKNHTEKFLTMDFGADGNLSL